MSDIPKNLRSAARLRCIVLIAAGLLTVVTVLLWWFELASGGSAASTAARTFFWGVTHVAWDGWILLSCTVFICQRLAEREARADELAERNTVRLIEAQCDRRLSNLADLMEEDGNVRWINRKR